MSDRPFRSMDVVAKLAGVRLREAVKVLQAAALIDDALGVQSVQETKATGLPLRKASDTERVACNEAYDEVMSYATAHGLKGRVSDIRYLD